MRLVNCSIEIETRNEINIMQDMIETYLKNNKKLDDYQKEELETLKNQLEALWYQW